MDKSSSDMSSSFGGISVWKVGGCHGRVTEVANTEASMSDVVIAILKLKKIRTRTAVNAKEVLKTALKFIFLKR